jgi:hypothetical protein
MFLGGSIAKRIGRILGPPDRDELLRCLRDYKAGGGKDAFEATIKVVGI